MGAIDFQGFGGIANSLGLRQVSAAADRIRPRRIVGLAGFPHIQHRFFDQRQVGGRRIHAVDIHEFVFDLIHQDRGMVAICAGQLVDVLAEIGPERLVQNRLAAVLSQQAEGDEHAVDHRAKSPGHALAIVVFQPFLARRQKLPQLHIGRKAQEAASLLAPQPFVIVRRLEALSDIDPVPKIAFDAVEQNRRAIHRHFAESKQGFLHIDRLVPGQNGQPKTV
ncbi:MAG: hypothetical protein BWZ10_01232 [candidate division BRC1 bacterium ADurb.BinA364]|nr:MAG: hypothetical protein BWZ10_01232 [candidate division BRC1 bacterium ADurb.BinA364]